MQEQRGQVPEEGDVEREQAYHIAQVRARAAGLVHRGKRAWGRLDWFGLRRLVHLSEPRPQKLNYCCKERWVCTGVLSSFFSARFLDGGKGA